MPGIHKMLQWTHSPGTTWGDLPCWYAVSATSKEKLLSYRIFKQGRFQYSVNWSSAELLNGGRQSGFWFYRTAKRFCETAEYGLLKVQNEESES